MPEITPGPIDAVRVREAKAVIAWRETWGAYVVEMLDEARAGLRPLAARRQLRNRLRARRRLPKLRRRGGPAGYAAALAQLRAAAEARRRLRREITLARAVLDCAARHW